MLSDWLAVANVRLCFVVVHHFDRRSCEYDWVEFLLEIRTRTSSTLVCRRWSRTHTTTLITSLETSLCSSYLAQSPSPTPFFRSAFQHVMSASISSKSASTLASAGRTTLVSCTVLVAHFRHFPLSFSIDASRQKQIHNTDLHCKWLIQIAGAVILSKLKFFYTKSGTERHCTISRALPRQISYQTPFIVRSLHHITHRKWSFYCAMLC